MLHRPHRDVAGDLVVPAGIEGVDDVHDHAGAYVPERVGVRRRGAVAGRVARARRARPVSRHVPWR
ncbi:hypothetical protein ACFYWP_12005 [Actinacidiphila glaucinigra]|uniref:hypothetical protein n=1 Tax=Actinacidiphila glaucinigra TaxID=235986 RepID=UPI003686896A